MSEHKPTIIYSHHDTDRGTMASYVSGFALSIIFTLLAYWMVVHKTFSGKALLIWLLGLAVAQFCGQLFFFLNVGRETKPRWKLLVLFLMIIFVLIVVLGSLWVMYNLNYHMSPAQMNKYMESQADGGL